MTELTRALADAVLRLGTEVQGLKERFEAQASELADRKAADADLVAVKDGVEAAVAALQAVQA